jgi:hypothetical protein
LFFPATVVEAVWEYCNEKEAQWFLSDLELAGKGKGKFMAENDAGGFFRVAV